MNAPVKRTVYKTVQVPVEITQLDLAQTLTSQELKDACRRRGIRLVEDKPPGSKLKIEHDAIENVISLRHRGDIEGAMMALERLLPLPLRNLSADVERHYRRAS